MLDGGYSLDVVREKPCVMKGYLTEFAPSDVECLRDGLPADM